MGATRAGCNLDLVDKDGKDRKGNPRDTCVSIEQIQRYDEALTNVSKLSWTEMGKETGCIAKCSYTQYSFEKLDEHSGDKLFWKTLSSSSFFLSAKQSRIKTEEE